MYSSYSCSRLIDANAAASGANASICCSSNYAASSFKLRCANAPYAASKQAAISCISITKPSGAICNELHHASASLIIINRRA